MKKLILFVMLCMPVALVAQTQNGVTVSGLEVNSGTVTFNVSWDKNAMPATPWSDTVWVFVDYNKNGVMTRLPVTSATATAGTVTTIPGNDKGVWVAGDARTNDSFSAKVELFTEIKDVAGACAYASNYPPVGKYTAADKIEFTGTPEYTIVIKKDAGGATETRTGGSPFTVPPGFTAQSFTDKTGAPGKFSCIPSATFTLTASAAGFCADAAGVTFSLSGTQAGRSYELYKNGAPTAVATLTGTDSAEPFGGSMTEGSYTAKVLASAGYCEAAMSGAPVVVSNPLPTQPTIAKPDDVCLNGGDIVFTSTGYSGSLTWTSAVGGAVNGNTVTFANGAATGIKTVTARTAQTYTNAPMCYSGEVTQWAGVLALPDTPILAVSASTVCLSTDIVFMVTSLVSGATYTWSGAEGTASGIGDGTYTVSSATTGTISVTAYARLTVNETTCQSTNASLSAMVSQPGTNGQEPGNCGCAYGLNYCSNSNICRSPSTSYGAVRCSGCQGVRDVLDECGAIVSTESYTNADCAAACCTPLTCGHTWKRVAGPSSTITTQEANAVCASYGTGACPGCSDKGGTMYATSWGSPVCNVNCSAYDIQVECSCRCK